MRRGWFFVLGLFLILLTGCENRRVIVNDVQERDANEILVFLASKGIACEKILAKSGAGFGGDSGPSTWNISVSEGNMMEAMALLNQNGLPRKQGTNLLTLFAKQGLMSSEKEEEIRYQAGLEQQIANTIRKIDGVLDADVQISFPSQDSLLSNQSVAPQKVTAAVYVKHQGVFDDPNSHLVSKIKRLVSGSVNGLDINDVTVVADRSRLTDISLSPTMEAAASPMRDFVSIWSIVMSKQSAARFRLLFFSLITVNIVFVTLSGWILWKFYPFLRDNGGLKELLSPFPLKTKSSSEKNETE